MQARKKKRAQLINSAILVEREPSYQEYLKDFSQLVRPQQKFTRFGRGLRALNVRLIRNPARGVCTNIANSESLTPNSTRLVE